MSRTDRFPEQVAATGAAPVTRPLRQEMVYTRSGRIGFLQSETAHTVTIQIRPDRSLTLAKEEVDCRFKLV